MRRRSWVNVWCDLLVSRKIGKLLNSVLRKHIQSIWHGPKDWPNLLGPELAWSSRSFFLLVLLFMSVSFILCLLIVGFQNTLFSSYKNHIIYPPDHACVQILVLVVSKNNKPKNSRKQNTHMGDALVTSSTAAVQWSITFCKACTRVYILRT